jgi:hypothetical protein
MSKSIRLLAATLLTALAATSAQADFVYTQQGAKFTYHGVDQNTFTLRIENILDATGNWASITHLGYLGVKGLGNLANLTGAAVLVTPAPSSAINWSFTKGELTGNGCNSNANSSSICLDATPDLPLTNDILFTIDLLGNGVDIRDVTAPQVKASFTAQGSNNSFTEVASFSQTLAADTGRLPEPASLALAGLALAGAAVARRRVRG